MTWAFGAMTMCSLARVAGPILVPGWYLSCLALGALLWMVAFVFYVIAFAPILLSPRVDGKPG
jgi:uncharacterized protein involved in response to NO